MNASSRKKNPFSLLLILTAILIWAWAGLLHSQETGSSRQKVYLVPAAGTVDPGMAAFLERALTDTAKDPDALVILDMDTFGGRVDSAFEIVDHVLNIPKGKTIAYVSKKAISAGALIALACRELVMRPQTTIGDVAPIIYSNEGPKMMGEKFQSPIRAKFRSLAKRNGYPETLTEAMVTADMTVYEVVIDGEKQYMDKVTYEDLPESEKEKITTKRTVVAEGELLTMDDVEARELGFSKMSADTIEEMLSRMGIEDYEIVKIEEVWSETFVRLINSIAPILMMIGLAGLYMELQAPGFGLPGIVGIICLGLVFFNQYLVGLANYTELMLITLGLLAMGYEIFVLPGFGIAGFTGIGLISIGMILSFQDFVLPDPELPWQFEILVRNLTLVLGSFVSAFVGSLFVMRYVFPSLSAITKEGPYLAANLRTSRADSEETILVRIGDSGMAETFLRPSGKVRVRGETVDAISEGEFIERGSPIKIIALKGNRVIVAPETEDRNG